MKNILLRAGKSPFDKIAPEEVYFDDLIAKNCGNLLFAHSAYKTLSVPGVQIDVTRYRNPAPEEAGEINEKYAQFVLPLANAFRREFIPQLTRLTLLIRKLKIPCIVMGVGAQADLDTAPGGPQLDKHVSDFMSAVLDRSSSVGVRGETTANYLARLGFGNVTVIGCPSMFLHGDGLQVTKKTASIDAQSPIACNLTTGMPGSIRTLYETLFSGELNATYIAQNRADIPLLLWGRQNKSDNDTDNFPRSPSEPPVGNGRSRIFFDVSTWIEFLSTQHFSLGTRIHGNLAALLAGTPACVLVHDSRTLELVRYFEIPHRRIDQVGKESRVADFYEEADCSRLVANHGRRYETYRGFLEANGIDHIFSHPGEAEKFDQRLAATALPPSIVPLSACTRDEVTHRLQRLATFSTARITALKAAASGAR